MRSHKRYEKSKEKQKEDLEEKVSTGKTRIQRQTK